MHRNQWVLGGYCRNDGKIFLVECPGNKRDRSTLIPLIKKIVKPGTTIYMDCWRAYYELANVGYHHEVVNHELNFVRPDDKNIHTNSIEGRWWQVKRWLPDSGRYTLKHHFPVYMLIVYLKHEGKNLFTEMLKLAFKYNETYSD